jgi:hypothetical protein
MGIEPGDADRNTARKSDALRFEVAKVAFAR